MTNGPVRIETAIGDLTDERTDAIVNAANSALVRGGGVCGAIFAKAGPQLDAACAALGSCPTGEARLTPAFGIPIRGSSMRSVRGMARKAAGKRCCWLPLGGIVWR